MGYRILIVDDSPIIRAMLKRAIDMTGVDVAATDMAENGIEAIKSLAANGADLVLADLNMPSMGGVELIKKMKANEHFSHVPVAVVSSDHSEARVQEMLQLGIVDYLKKPFRPEHLKKLLDKVFAAEE